MILLTILSEAFLYLSFSILLGSFILQLVPETSRPDIKISKGILLTATLGVAFLSFVPVLNIILYLYKDMGLGFTIQSVLTNFEIGKTWVKTGIVSTVLFIYLIPIKLERKPSFSLTGLFIVLVLIFLAGQSSHASSISGWQGALTHVTHFLAVTTWTGILIVVSWFSRDYANWQRFLKWFTPVALTCLALVALTGFDLMGYTMNEGDYVNSWSLSYGQALLLKHLTIIPLLAFAFINSTLVRKKISAQSTFNPLPWARLESVVVLLVFGITGALGEQAPPHVIETTIKEDGISPLFSLFHKGELTLPLQIAPGIPSIVFSLAAVGFLALIIFIFIKKVPKVLALVMSILFILAGYLALMLSI
jgi:putative copper export protein